MDDLNKPVLIYATYPDAAAAETAGRFLVNEGLAACVNVLATMTSIYRWEGAVEQAAECAVIIKTRAGLTQRVIEEAKSRHPYALPAFVVLPIVGGHQPYLDWIVSSVTAGS